MGFDSYQSEPSDWERQENENYNDIDISSLKISDLSLEHLESNRQVLLKSQNELEYHANRLKAGDTSLCQEEKEFFINQFTQNLEETRVLIDIYDKCIAFKQLGIQ